MSRRLFRRQETIRTVAARCITSVCLCTMMLLVLPCMVLAASYDVGPVDIDATLSADGSLEVTERRTYVFSGNFNGIYWDVPRGAYEGREIGTTIISIGVLRDGELQVFSPGSDGAPGTYELSERPDCLHLKIYWSVTDEPMIFQVSYVMSGLASRWADVGELYWQYVPADPASDLEWTDVTAAVHLPIPGGEPVNPGQNVRAWGHGPLDGQLRFKGNDVVFYSPGVGAAEFLEARITLPPSWLSGVAPSQESRLDTILAEEDQWARDANAKRLHARLIAFGYPGFMVLAALGTVVITVLFKKGRLARIPRAEFNDTYYRDIPAPYHPAILGMLHREGKMDAKDFSATLMRLASQGRVALDAVGTEKKDQHGHINRSRDWRLLLHRNVEGGASDYAGAAGRRIDDRAFDFLDNVIADKNRHVIDQSLLGPNGEPYVLTSFFEETAKSWPQAYERGYNGWADELRAAYKKRGFERKPDEVFPIGMLGLAVIAVSVILAIVGMFLLVPNGLLAAGFILLFASGVYALLSDEDEPAFIYTQEAVELKAKLEALKRWLTDFTRLEEAIPTDVVLWNRLLVMATEFGIADKVVKQLRVCAPELIADPALSSYLWCSRDDEDELEDPAKMIGRSVAAAKKTSTGKLYHEVSTYDVATSHNSSSKGSGGGFSGGGGGGGGGFSGGGRGGAF